MADSRAGARGMSALGPFTITIIGTVMMRTTVQT
jgi:hypothetical protein